MAKPAAKGTPVVSAPHSLASERVVEDKAKRAPPAEVRIRRIVTALSGCLTVEHSGSLTKTGGLRSGVNVINQFIFASSPSLIKKREIELAGCDDIIAGHSG